MIYETSRLRKLEVLFHSDTGNIYTTAFSKTFSLRSRSSVTLLLHRLVPPTARLRATSARFLVAGSRNHSRWDRG